MRIETGDTWLDEFVTSAAVARAGSHNSFYRARRAGRFVTLRAGVHLPSHVWSGMDADARFRARIHALALSAAEPLLFSHLSAAAIWRLPMVGTWPEQPEVLRCRTGSGAVRSGFRVHTGDDARSTAIIDSVQVTGLARTVVDVARRSLLGTAVTMADAALSGEAARHPARGGAVTTPAELREELAIGSRTGKTRAARALELADGASGSPGESVSRVAMHLEGFPRPVLQHRFSDERGLIGFVDFWWPDFGLIGEFDGKGKYSRTDLLNGRSPAEAVIAEKKREDRLRALGPRVVRWGWEAAISPPRLARILRAAGLR